MPEYRPEEWTAVGIDVAEERKGLDLVALDGRRRLQASFGRLTISDVADIVLTDLRPAIVCIDSPSGWSTSGKSRVGERELRKLGITAFSTGADPGDHPFYRWMRVGFALYEALSPPYELLRGGSPMGVAAEVFPEASAVLLAGRHRGEDSKLTFRRHVLRSHGVDDQALPTIDRVDAALGALTGVLALEGICTMVGDPGEGLMLLPVATLPSSPLVRSGTARRRVRPSPDASTTGPHLCLCGCGAPVRRRFLPGHDAKLKSRLTRDHLAGNADARERLHELGWVLRSEPAPSSP